MAITADFFATRGAVVEGGVRAARAIGWTLPGAAAEWRAMSLPVAAAPARPAAARRRDEFTALRNLAAQKAWLAARGIPNPYFPLHEGAAGARTRIGGRELLNFSSYNYLGLNGHPAVSAAAKAAIDQHGTTVSASRIVAGERPLHGELERALAAFLGTEDALAFVSGHGTNVTAIPDLVGSGDVVFHDAHIHNSALLGAKLSGAKRVPFPHNAPAKLAALLERHRGAARRALIIVEGVYSMDGDPCDLPAFVTLKHRYDARLMVDEAHALGVLGATGRGAGEHCGVAAAEVDLWMGTLSKTLASCGGFLAGRHELIETLRYFTPGFMFSVGLPPPAAGAALAALRTLAAEPERVTRVRARAEFFRSLACARGWAIGPSRDSAIVPLIVGDSERTLRLAAVLLAAGVAVPPIVYPGVAHRQARLRFFFNCDHTEADIHAAVAAVAAAWPAA
ncbi:MAG: hypothetical protein RLZZ15_3508 [Verrucomicrobiota bacterium]|jgi:8-amino-7-oxononanoate synthase